MDESPPLEHNLSQSDLLEPSLRPDIGLTSRSNSYRGSISSSLASPDKETPNRLQRDESHSPASRRNSAVLGDTLSRIYDHLPTPSPLRSVGRTATTGVGLGIPTLSSGGVFGRGWETGRREGEATGSPLANVSRGPREDYTEEDYFSRPEQHRDRRGSVVDKATGLPSPPGTNSDITAPIEDQSSSSLMVESPPPLLPSSSLPYSRSVSGYSRRSSRTPSLPSSPEKLSRSSGSSHKSLQPLQIDNLSGSGSEGQYQPSNRRSSHSSRASTSSSSRLKTLQTESSSSNSPAKPTHRYSPSAPVNMSPERPSQRRRSSRRSILEEDPPPGHRDTEGAKRDALINTIEENSARSHRRVDSSQYSTVSPTKPRRHRSYERVSPQKQSDAEEIHTLRPVSSRLTHQEDDNSPERSTYSSRRDRAQRDEHSGGSAGTKQRKGLPLQFTNGTLSTPSPQKSSAILDRLDSRGSPSRYGVASRTLDSSHVYSPRSPLSGLEGSSSLSPRRSLRGSGISGLPNRHDGPDLGRIWPRSQRRPESISVPQTLRSSTSTRTRLSSRELEPSDSLSTAGRAGTTSDINSILDNFELQRERQNQTWRTERSQSVLGSPDRQSFTPDRSPSRNVRPTTSMSGIRSAGMGSNRDRAYRASVDSSPSLHRAVSRLSHEPSAAGSRGSIASSSTEHGKRLYEAAGVLASRLESIGSTDFVRNVNSATRSTENTNASLRTALQVVVQLEEMCDTESRQALQHLAEIIKDANKASESSIRDLTVLMLDTSKILKEGLPTRSSDSVMIDRSIRRSEESARPSTSYDLYPSSSKMRQRETLPADFGDRRKAALRSSQQPETRPIVDSPTRYESRGLTRAVSLSHRKPDSPRNTLKKKASTTSTHTVKAGGSFLPGKTSTTTAISTVNVGNGLPDDFDLPTPSPKAESSFRSQQSSHRFAGDEGSSSSINRRTSTSSRSSTWRSDDYDVVAKLAALEKNRERGNETVKLNQSENQVEPASPVSASPFKRRNTISRLRGMFSREETTS